jgi:hypothetical protein
MVVLQKGSMYGHGGVPVADHRSPAAATAVGPHGPDRVWWTLR